MESNDARKDEYDISQYSDEELLTILDLNHNPTDRELEAKIIFNINKYKNIAGESGAQLAIFFEDIYAHFFELVEEGEHENQDGQETNTSVEEIDTKMAPEERAMDEGFNNNAPKSTTLIEPQSNRENEAPVGYTRNLAYTT